MSRSIDFKIEEIIPEDKSLIKSFISENWGSSMSVSKGNIYDTTDLPGFIYKYEGEIIGLITYHIDGDECEIVTLDSMLNNRGLATQLINKVADIAQQSGCKRVWLITTNDNTNAIRFYQKRGFEWAGFYKDAINNSRKLKPEIPESGFDDIPVKHEIEFELRLPVPNKTY